MLINVEAPGIDVNQWPRADFKAHGIGPGGSRFPEGGWRQRCRDQRRIAEGVAQMVL